MQKTYLVFGATGSIGQGIVKQLLNQGHEVIVPVRKWNSRLTIKDDNLHYIPYSDHIIGVEDERFVKWVQWVLCSKTFEASVDGVIYSVGHCPPGGFTEAIKYSLSQLPIEDYEREINLHQKGVLNVYKTFVQKIIENGCFVFMSSAITRLRGKFPPFLQAHYHASVIDAQDWLIEGMRHDPVVAERKIKIHRLAPSAVDTPFHQGDGPKPPAMISVDSVVDEVMQALESDTHVDKQLLPA